MRASTSGLTMFTAVEIRTAPHTAGKVSRRQKNIKKTAAPKGTLIVNISWKNVKISSANSAAATPSVSTATIVHRPAATASRSFIAGRHGRHNDRTMSAEADIASAASRLESEIAAQVAVLSGEAADRIVADRLDNATMKELVEQFIANVGAAS